VDITKFHNLHHGETCLFASNGPNLGLTPPEKFNYLSFGVNRIYQYEGWKPTYYTAVDSLIMTEDGAAIADKYREIPKFVPTPNLDAWKGENFFRFYHRPGRLWFPSQSAMWTPECLITEGITYSNITHIVMQLAYYMGFRKLLIIGMSHQVGKGCAHFYGNDESCNNWPSLENWFEGYQVLREELGRQGLEILNISEDTHVPESVIPRGDWREYAS
jgi:hypothetical protein